MTKTATPATPVVIENTVALTPLTMLDRAITSGAGIDVLERLVALSERWQANQAERAFTEALAAIRADLPQIAKTRTVDFSTSRGRTHYRYEDLAELAEALSPVMAKHGLSFRWRTDSTQKGQVSVTCILAHRDGHSEETTLAGPYDDSGNKNPIQAIGSVVTYLQRYTLKAAIGVAAANDDDGRQGAPSNAPPNGGANRMGARKTDAPAPRPALARAEPPPAKTAASGQISEAQARRIVAIAREVGEEHGAHGFHVVNSTLQGAGLPTMPGRTKIDECLNFLCEHVVPESYELFCDALEQWTPSGDEKP